MLSININIIYFVLITFIVEIQSLVQLSKAENNSIKIADRAIRNTINELFNTLKIQNINQNPRLKQFYSIHNYFSWMTLSDCNSLENIIGLSRVNEIENNTQYLITIVNEAITDSDKNGETTGYNIFVAKHIQTVIAKLKYLKEKYVSKKKTSILKHIKKTDKALRELRKYQNFTKSIEETKEEEENSTSYSDFWKPSGRRIFEGSRTSIKQFPFVTSIQFFKKFQCAGAMIKDDLVITSASCLQLAWNNRFFRENPAFITAQVGSNYYEYEGENIPALEIYFHPSYNPNTLQNNLAIVRLTRKVNFKKSRKTKKIDIDRSPFPLADYSKITIVGWGAIDDYNIIYDVFRNKITYAELDFYPLKECIEHYTSDYVSIKNFCAGFFSKGGGACNRDAGGPAVIDGVLIGVISFGSALCGAPDSPTVFTKLGYYADWIDDIIEQELPSMGKRTTTLAPKYLPIDGEAGTTGTPLIVTPMGTFPLQDALQDETEALRTVREQDLYDILPSIFSSKEIQELLGEQQSELKEFQRIPLETYQNQNESVIKITPKQPKSASRQQNINEDIGYDALIEASTDSVTNMASFEKSNNSSLDVIKTQTESSLRQQEINKDISYDTSEESSTEYITKMTSFDISNDSTKNVVITQTENTLRQQQINDDVSFDTSIETSKESFIRMAPSVKSNYSTKNFVMNSVENLQIDKFLDAIISYNDSADLTEDSNDSNERIVKAERKYSINHVSSTETDEEGMSISADPSENITFVNDSIETSNDRIPKSLLLRLARALAHNKGLL